MPRKKYFRPVHTPAHFAALFKREGLEAGRLRRGRVAAQINLSELHDASIFLFKHILHPSDVRWGIATRYAELKKEVPFHPINLENGLRAVYSSRTQGRNKEYGASITGQTHVLQAVRALRNIELGHEHFAWRKPLSIAGRYEARFVQTDSIQKKLNRFGVSGCPEALWQMQLWSPKGYLGRIGINFHTENGKKIVTISNVQGAQGKKEEQQEFQNLVGKNFGEALVERLQKTLGPSFEYRGAVPTEKNQALYRMTFRKAKPSRVPVWDNKIKQQIEDRRTIKP